MPTRDFEQAGEFYGAVLGLPCSARWGRMPAAESGLTAGSGRGEHAPADEGPLDRPALGSEAGAVVFATPRD